MNKLLHHAHLPLKTKPDQSGFALVAALVFLLVLTILGVAALASNATEEKITYAVADYNRSFQAADSAVVEAETWLSLQSILPGQTVSCASSCAPLVWQAGMPLASYATAHNWETFAWSSYARSFYNEYAADGSSVIRPTSTLVRIQNSYLPRYVIEELGPDTLSSLTQGQGKQPHRYYYRITAQGQGSTSGQNASYAQSIFVQSFN